MTNYNERLEQWAVKQHLEKYPKCEWVCMRTKYENLGEVKGEAVQYKMDGDKWCATLESFVNLQESPAGFDDSKEQALVQLREKL